ncbi:MAG: hypothetical protein JW866_00035 [Ignavibacteriales bacterium]|nr:hypothetical protein [Ignavibacteriales bacterium]
MKLNIFQIIKEEIQDYFSDWGVSEPSIADKYYEKRLGISQSPPPEEINAELFGFVTMQWDKPMKQPIPVYKNPRTLTGFLSDTRGILLNNGDLYLAQSYNALHENILELLAEHGIVPITSIAGYEQNFPQQFVAVVRAGNSTTFGQSSAYDYFPEHYVEIFKTGNEKQPFNFKHYSYS